ncbi:DUF6384 family protein [Apibacter sp. B2912]|uniref:DUF6384 family protein n=1 Tax=Apibacter sp. B2912 TaxID=2656763 RepID=UPI00136895BC|nr:DUF6384 family protein [Apibacter sp. B2912]MXO33068.1 hypothetical protein [Apibacter sp. B2912]
MDEIKVSDQLGAMAIIDELHQKQQLLNEHLDRDKLRNNLEHGIKNYYQSQGLDVDNETIEMGIDQWFDNRLHFIESKRSRFQHFLAFCYIKRGVFCKWFRYALLTPVMIFIWFCIISLNFLICYHIVTNYIFKYIDQLK